MAFDVNYAVRPIDKDVYEVAKFECHKWPEEVFTVRVPKEPNAHRPLWCSCPGFSRTLPHLHHMHKHVRIVEAYIAAGCPILAFFTLEESGTITYTQMV